MLSDSSSVKVSPLDLVTSILRGGMSSGDQANASADSEVMTLLLEKNREVVVMALTTAFAVLIGCVFFYLWRVSSNQKAAEKNKKKAVEVARKPMMAKEDEDDGKKKVTIFFGTQTGTAEGFAKVLTFYELSQILQ